MSTLDDLVQVQFSTTNPGVTAAGFGVPLIASPNATWVERTRTYSDIDGVADDWGTASPEYRAASVMFSQETGLESLMIGRCANVPTQRFSVGVNSVVASTVYKLRVACNNNGVWTSQEADYTATPAVAWAINTAYTQGQLVVNDSAPLKFYICTQSGTSAGSGGPTGTGSSIADNTVVWMYAGTGTLSTTTNDAIVYGLKLLLDGFAAPVLATANTLTGSVGSKSLQILANTAGAFFGVEVVDMNFLSVAQNHADPGITADLVALAQASTAWYGLITLYNSTDMILAAAAWAEANQKLYITASQDSAIATTADSVATDVFHQLKTHAYARTGPFFHPANDEFADAAEIARWFPIDPGQDNWRLKTLTGVTTKTYSSTWITNITDKYANYYAVLAGTNVVQGGGKVSANEYIDVVRGLDWYKARLQERGANLLIQSEKVPFTDAGLSMIENLVKAQNAEGVRQGVIAPDSPDTPITVTVPSLSEINPSDKQNRLLRGITTSWTLAEAINSLQVTVKDTP